MLKSLPVHRKYFQFVWLSVAFVGNNVFSQDLLKNGDFEAGQLPPWEITQVSGSSIALAATESSPFTSIFAQGSASVRLKDDDSDFEQPSMRQFFDPHGAIVFGFDFKVGNPGEGSRWNVAWQGENSTTAFFFSIGGADGMSIELNLQKVTDLKTNIWYHIEGSADAATQKLEGTILNTAGDRVPFQGGFPFGVKNSMNGVSASDGDEARNPDILLDNIFSRPISLAIGINSQGEIVVTWLDSSFTLESTALLGAAAEWTAILDAHGAYTNTFSDGSRFFRLRE